MKAVDLSQVRLSSEQKAWLMRRIESNEESASSLAKRFNLSRRTLNVQVCRHRKGKGLQEMGGRPRIFKKDGLRSLAMFAQEEPHPTFQQFQAHITHVYEEEHRIGEDSDNNQSVGALEPEEPNVTPKISQRSLKRYAMMCDNLEIVNLVDAIPRI
jgi:hypothetical protein